MIESLIKNKFELKSTVMFKSNGITSSSFVSRVTFPKRTILGIRLEGAQCAAVTIKYSEIIVPPQSKLIPSEN